MLKGKTGGSIDLPVSYMLYKPDMQALQGYMMPYRQALQMAERWLRCRRYR